ncbi:MAG: sigma-70 family RNA polymerase sigma factor [Chloroflexota bacterium]
MTALPRATHSPSSKAALLAAGAAAPAGFLDAAYRQYFSSTYAAAMRTTRDPDAAADVTQEAFMRLLSEAHQGRRPDNTAAWLSRSATNVAISRARRTTVARRYAPLLLDRSTPPLPEAIALCRERDIEVRKALAILRPAERRALMLAAQGISGSEIARDLGRSHGATRALICRARTRLRESGTLGLTA